MLLSELLTGVQYRAFTGGDAKIEHLSCGSDRVFRGTLFFCFKGGNADGHDFALEAAAGGAAAIVCERPIEVKLPQVLVHDARAAMGVMAGNFYGNPARKMKIIGITGTNGKTTTTYIIRAVARAAGIKTGIIGTAGIIIGESVRPPLLTTPDPIDLHCIFAEMLAAGTEWVIMEVSAHAIELRKTEGICFDVAAFTNLTPDHLDFFKDMEAYKKAKTKLFTPAHARTAVVNVDDACGMEIMKSAAIPVYSYGCNNPSDVFAIDYESDADGLKYVINSFDDIENITFRMPGRFNLYNTLCAASVCHLLGVPLKTVAEGISNMDLVPGRFNVLASGRGFNIIIDYAHTPDGLSNVLRAIKEFCKGRIITVFGCGGNRDRTKRPLMARAVAEYSDYAVLTSDNPRFENPMDIILQAEAGFTQLNYTSYTLVENRRAAVRAALNRARAGDIVLIAGKGDEPYQEIRGVKTPYSDFDTVDDLLYEMQQYGAEEEAAAALHSQTTPKD